MRLAASLSSVLQRLALTVLMAAALLHGALPPGYMAATASGHIVIELRSASGEHLMLDLCTGQYSSEAPAPDDERQRSHDARCPFAAAAEPMIVAHAQTVAPAADVSLPVRRVETLRVAPALGAPSPFLARGPPLQA